MPNDLHENLFTRAVRAYLRRCDRSGVMRQQPSRASSDIDDGGVVLRNTRGELARFRYDASRDRLTMLA